MSDGTSTTGSVLFGLLERPSDQHAWERFVDRYGPKILAWCKSFGLQPADAEDIAQQVLLIFMQKAVAFQYDPNGSFRGWLRTITHHAVTDLFKKFGRLRGGGNRELLEQLQQPAALKSLDDSLDEEFERELLERAMQLVQLDVKPNTWRAFELTTFEQCTGAQAAAELGMTVAAVYMAKNRVQRMLRERIEQLGGKS